MKMVTGMLIFDERTPLSVYNDFLWEVDEAVPGMIESSYRLSAELVFETLMEPAEETAFTAILNRYMPYMREALVDIYTMTVQEHIHKTAESE